MTGWRARIGVLVIAKDPVPEEEFWAMAPAGVSVHSARFDSPRKKGSDFTGDHAAALAESPDIARGLDQLGQMPLDVICLCFGSSSFLAGVGFDERFCAQAERRTRGVPVTTAPLAMLAAMRSLRVTRPHLVIPPWFTPTSLAAARRYLEDSGFPAAGETRFSLGAGWGDRESFEAWDLDAQWEVRGEEVYRQTRRGFDHSADCVLVPGSGFRALAAIEPLECDLGVPVITSNQACLWHCLRIAGASDAGVGRLFEAARGDAVCL
ncbi:maleate cis-trans isomerase family protein [Actinokineospora sp. HUAS TT18]|uniref:maleate cis-trans isomerase family protein n=1 Tax=Actinokineospora sp. HUAS TT18 TaxID=3447451 RepID=UPI003F51FDC5